MDIDSHGHKEDKKREKDRDRKHRKRHQSPTEDLGSDKDEKDDSNKKQRKHNSSDRKKSRKVIIRPFESFSNVSMDLIFFYYSLSCQHAYSPDSDSESRHKKHRRDHRSSRRNGGYDELEDGELGEDGEIQ